MFTLGLLHWVSARQTDTLEVKKKGFDFLLARIGSLACGGNRLREESSQIKDISPPLRREREHSVQREGCFVES